MSKQRLIDAIKSEKISSQDLKTLKDIARQHPYSQIIHSLVAKGSYQNGDKTAQSALHVAAMYATDRQVLKSLITSGQSIQTKSKSPSPAKPSVQKPVAPQQNQKSEISPSPKQKMTTEYKVSSGEKLRQEVLHNLELLMDSKKPYSGKELEESVLSQPKSKDKKEEKSKKPKAAPKVKKEKSKPESAKKTKKVEAKKSKAKVDKVDTKEKAKDPKKKKVKEQIELIDQFIKKKPSISIAKIKSIESDQNQEDLSIPSADFGEDLISENLAKILISQGKKDKAIDIYKKLIWQFPQKKAYFATQIEELKK